MSKYIGKVDLVLSDIPFNVMKGMSANQCVSHDTITDESIAAYINAVVPFLKPDANLIIICGHQQQQFVLETMKKNNLLAETAIIVKDHSKVKQNIRTTVLINAYFSIVIGHRSSNYYFNTTELPDIPDNSGARKMMKDSKPYTNVIQGYLPPFKYLLHEPGAVVPNSEKTRDQLRKSRVTKASKAKKKKEAVVRPQEKGVGILQLLCHKYATPGGIVMDNFAGIKHTRHIYFIQIMLRTRWQEWMNQNRFSHIFLSRCLFFFRVFVVLLRYCLVWSCVSSGRPLLPRQRAVYNNSHRLP